MRARGLWSAIIVAMATPVMGFVAPPTASIGGARLSASRRALCGAVPRRRVGGLRLSAMMSPEELLAAYTVLLVTDPVPTKLATASVLGAAGDVVAQLAEAAGKDGLAAFSLDQRRALSMVSFSALYTGMFQAWWITTLQENVHLVDPLADAAVKTGLCQFGTIPVVYMPTFFLVTGSVRGMDLQASLDNAKENYVRIYSRNVGYWIPVQIVQFFYVPQEWQITFLCIAGFVWTVILSSLALNQQTTTPTAAGNGRKVKRTRADVERERNR